MKILIILCVISFLLVAVLLGFCVNLKRRTDGLSKSISGFINGGPLTPISTKDDTLSQLQTNINELEVRLLREKEYAKIEAKKNASFISDISHQLKTPLAGIRLYCELEHSVSPDTHTEKELELIEKMEKLIYNVLKLEKIRSDTYTMEYKEAELCDIFVGLKAEFGVLFPEKEIAVKGNAKLRCDKSWLGEAFGNIIKNACEHTKPNGKIDINIEKGEKSVTVTVEDNGGGVPNRELQLIFSRFHRTENASPDSTGIGLSIAKEIVKRHHGTISVENGKDGLCVIMCFPIIDGNLKL